MATLQSFIRMRPFLWLLALAVVVMLLALTLEGTTSYDDGGLGSLTFALLFTVGFPFLLPSMVLNAVSDPTHLHWWNYLAWPLGILFGITFYLGLDRWTMAWLRRQN
jgi:hypothetical protein